MRKRYRGWILGIGLLVIAVVGTVIGLRLSSGPTLNSAGMAAYMPQRDGAVLYLDIRPLRSSGILDKLVGSTVGEEAEYKAFLQQTGFDYKRDLDRVMGNVAAADGAGATQYFLLDGRFDWERLKAYARTQGGACDGDFCSVKGSVPDRMISFYPISKTLMALASSPNDKAARDITSRTAVKPGYNTPNTPMWLYVPGSALQKQGNLPSGTRLFTRALEPAQHVIFSLGPVGDRFELSMDVTCRTVEEAAVLKNQLEGLTQVLKSFIAREKQAPSKKDLSGVLTAGAFQRQSEHVIGSWPIEKDFIEAIGQ